MTGPSGDPSCLGGIWSSSDGQAWRCDASDPSFTGFGPYAAAGSPDVEIAVGLTSAGPESPDGLPGAVWSRPAASAGPPAASPSDGPSAEPAAILDVTCGTAAPVLSSDRVRAAADGIRIRVTGEPGWVLGIGGDSGQESVQLEAATQDLVLRIAPGDVTVECGDPTLPNLSPTSPLRVEDPDGWYRSMAIGAGAGSCFAGIVDYAEGARGDTVDPVLQARKALRGLKPGDIVERAGYPVDRGSVRVVRAGEVIGVLGYEADGHGGWLSTGSTLCGGLGAG
jgi:hypothetical protein